MERGKRGRKGSAELATQVSSEVKEATGRIIGAAIAVHVELGPGFLESVYHRAMELELRQRGIPFESEVECEVRYRGLAVGRHRFDLIAGNGILVELRAVQSLDAVHFAQVRAYLEASRLSVGLLLDFAAPTLVIRRVVATRHTP
jgi:GxxExxY protein